MRKIVPIVIFAGSVVALVGVSLFSEFARNGHILGGPNSIVRNPAQIWGGSNSVINNPGQLVSSAWTPILTIQLGVTIIFVCASMFVILSKKYAPAERHWAYGALGTILGFWLHST